MLDAPACEGPGLSVSLSVSFSNGHHRSRGSGRRLTLSTWPGMNAGEHPGTRRTGRPTDLESERLILACVDSQPARRTELCRLMVAHQNDHKDTSRDTARDTRTQAGTRVWGQACEQTCEQTCEQAATQGALQEGMQENMQEAARAWELDGAQPCGRAGKQACWRAGLKAGAIESKGKGRYFLDRIDEPKAKSDSGLGSCDSGL